MLTDKNIKTVIQFLLLIAIFTYTLFGELPSYLLMNYSDSNSLNNLSYIFRIGSIIISFFVVISSIKSKWIVKKILGEKYIAGKYIGNSIKINGSKKSQITHKEIVIINQSLLSSTITGTSYDDEGFYASWSGKLVTQEEYVSNFLVSINTSRQINVSELSFLSLTIIENEANGFGLSIAAGDNYKWRFSLEKDKSII